MHAARAARQGAKANFQQQQDWLEVALASLGEAVITADTDLTVTFCNQAAENLTGWQAVDAHGRLLTAILHLLDEPTRQPLTVSLDQVVQQGIVLGLGEQTLLLRPTDTCVPSLAVRPPYGTRRGSCRGSYWWRGISLLPGASRHNCSRARSSPPLVR